MNILVYIPSISKKNGGIYQYTMGLLNVLKGSKKHQFFILNNESDDQLNTLIATQENFHSLNDRCLELPNDWVNRVVRRGKRSLPNMFRPARTPIEQIINNNRIALVHCPFQAYLNTGSTPFITTMHDVQELHFPEFFTSEERARRAVAYKEAIEQSNRVVVSYQHIKNDLVKFFDVPASNIEVVLLDMTRLWIDDFSEQNLINIRDLAVPQKYLLYPAATWHHKNHITLLEALMSLKEEGTTVNIVFTGHLTEHYEEVLKPFVERHHLNDQCTFKGIVSDQELYSLYNYAQGVVIPTLYEAGSFPLYESILLNIPVICSDTTSLPETIGTSDYVFEATNVEALKGLIKNLYLDDHFRDKNKLWVIDRAATFRSATALGKFEKLYDSIMKTSPVTEYFT
ncbi:hypothetical protein BCY91_12195 [Pelobium manganitolerans]|uniref:Glycosyl transferase family 1 domain-containing protein n=1 Tax=Pelobium manganitolerans TaxID=1842495 RepID=A0A419S1N8_9SPHI|nr:glycosyltransferase family 1 protein [Pelobium manganitolerans]RKD12404.1 hypothetical protein BCY91_12195 [Pelobium manganitolerans]